mgnify:CR=1 FL=1
MFNSIEEICDEFKIKYSTDNKEIMDQLRKLQFSVHPDIANPDESKFRDERDAEKYYRIEEAKEFIRRNMKAENISNDKELLTVSEFKKLYSIIKSNEISEVKKIENDFNETYETKFKQIKYSFLPKKITIGSIMAVITFIWSFPSVFASNPAIQLLFGGMYGEVGNAILTFVWLYFMLILLIFLFITFSRETLVKNILYAFKNEKFQYEVLSLYIHNKFGSKEIIDKGEFEKFIMNEVLYNRKSLRGHLKNTTLRNKIPNSTKIYIEELIPKLSDMIIHKALEKGLIEKSSVLSWSEKYVIKDYSVFDINF